MKNVFTRRFKRPLVLLIFLLLFGVNACRKQDTSSPHFTSGYGSYSSRFTLRPEEVTNWLKTLPPEFYQDVYIDKAQQSVINRHHVVRIPIGKDAALFFTKDNDSLKVFLYKWQDKQPGAKSFTGNLVSYSFQDKLLRTIIYQQGKISSYRQYNQPLFLKSAYWHNNNANGNILYSLWGKITNREITPPAPKMTFQPVVNHIAASTTAAQSGGVLNKLWCWLTGGTWISQQDIDNGISIGANGDPGRVGCNHEVNDDSDEEEEAAIDWMQNGFIGGGNGDMYIGSGSNNTPSNIGSDGGSVNILPPYGGGDVWITVWVQDPRPDGCDVPGGGDQPPSSTIDDSSGGCDGGGHWETYRLNVPDLNDPQFDPELPALLDTTGLSSHPRFKTIVTELPAFLQQYPNIVNALSFYTGFSNTKVLRLMKPGVGPKIKLVPHLTDFYTKGDLFGQYDNKTKTLEINEDYVSALDAATPSRKIQAISLLLAITALHEFVHYGRDVNGLSRLFFDPQDGAAEAGLSFEKDIDSNKTEGINSNTTYIWMRIYPFNF